MLDRSRTLGEESGEEEADAVAVKPEFPVGARPAKGPGSRGGKGAYNTASKKLNALMAQFQGAGSSSSTPINLLEQLTTQLAQPRQPPRDTAPDEAMQSEAAVSAADEKMSALTSERDDAVRARDEATSARAILSRELELANSRITLLEREVAEQKAELAQLRGDLLEQYKAGLKEGLAQGLSARS